MLLHLIVNETAGKAFTVAPSGDWLRAYDFGGIVFDSDSEGGIGFKKGVKYWATTNSRTSNARA